MKVLIASNNLGKVAIYKAVFDKLGIETTYPKEMGISVEVEENGKTETENAVLKAKAFHEATGLPTIANDSGLVIDKFSAEDQPGVLVRRFGGRELSDEEMLQVYIDKLNEVGGSSTGHYNVALALIDENGNLFTREFQPKRYFVNKPSSVLKKGVPLSSLAYDEETGKYMSEMTPEEYQAYEAEAMQGQKDFIVEIFGK